MNPQELSRYQRQSQYPPLGTEGQSRICKSRVLVCGCGALGTVLANTLVRAGVGTIVLVDRDFVEWTNLQRQVLFDEEDARSGMPKAIAAAEKLRRINSQIKIEPIVADVTHENLPEIAEESDLLLDGTDNFETRFLLNDFAIREKIPWVYGGCLGAEGQTMSILPGETACLACLMPEPPPAGSAPTCDTAGILAPIINVIASLQAAEAIKILSGNRAAVSRMLTVIDVWENRHRQIDLSALQAAGTCRACAHRQFDWLLGSRGSQTAVLCGRNAVQIRGAANEALPLPELAKRLRSVGEIEQNPFLLRLKLKDYTITYFADGRAIISGTDDPTIARAIMSKYIGS